MTFHNGNTYNINDPDLQYFITSTQLCREIQSRTLIFSFLKDPNYNLNYGVKNQRGIISLEI